MKLTPINHAKIQAENIIDNYTKWQKPQNTPQEDVKYELLDSLHNTLDKSSPTEQTSVVGKLNENVGH